MAAKYEPKRIEKYGLKWPALIDPAAIELDMIRQGGRWRKKAGGFAGEGLPVHYRNLTAILWPHIVWHDWVELQVNEWTSHRTVVVIGPASTGKTAITGALCHLIDYYAWPDCTTTICCSTTKERLEDRVWGEIKNLHKSAKRLKPWLPGHLIEGRQRIITDDRNEVSEGRDFRNGMVGVPCKRGDTYVGLGDFIGIKNKRVNLLGDELHLLPRAFVDSISNLDKNPSFKCTGLGNPKDTTDALGVLAEPSAALGGWDGGIDQTGGTKSWPTRRPDGVCIQLVGSDSPNLDGKLGIPLITQEQIDRDIAFYGRDSVQFTMMNEGRMPRGQGSRRVLTRQMCFKFKAMEEPVWNDSNRTKIAFLDAAYRGVGGDRCIFGILEFGYERPESTADMLVSSMISRSPHDPDRRQIISLKDIMVVPIQATSNDLPEDQIVEFVMGHCVSEGIQPENFFFDSGMRTSLVTAFSRVWSNSVNSVDCGGPASEDQVSTELTIKCRDYYSKFITQLWYSVRLCVEASQFRNMREDVMMEFCSREWTTVSGNRIEVEPKHKMKEKIGRSPDLADGVAVGLHGAIRHGFRIMKLSTQRQKKNREPDWKRDLMKRSRSLARSGAINYAA